MDRHASSPIANGFEQRGDDARTPRQAVRSGLRQLREVLHRFAQGAGAASLRPEGRGGRHRHPAGGAGPRDELRAGHCRSARACRSRRSRSHSATPTLCRRAAARIPAARCATPARCSPWRRGLDREGKATRCASLRRRPSNRSRSTKASSARRAPTAPFDLFELGEAKRFARIFPRFADGFWPSSATTKCTVQVFPNGARICEIEIDPDTGRRSIKRYATVDDVGRCINPLIVHGQTHGGIAQGVGQALWEVCVIDPEFRSAARRLADGLRHAALGQHAVVQDRDR